MVFQNFNLFPHKKVVDNIILAPKLLKKDNNDELHKEALSLLDKVGLKEKQMYIRINYQVVKSKGLQLQEL